MVGSCLMMSVIPIAASIPLITVTGMYFATLLALNTPMSICNAPASIIANKNASIPTFCRALTTMATSPAAGPETLKGDLLMRPTTRPHTTHAIIPLIRGILLATAIPRHKGIATRKTANQLGRSYLRERNM